MNDFVTCPHCGEISNIGGLVGQTTDDCPKCGKSVLEKPLLVWEELWKAMETYPDKWIPTTEKMYWEMLEVLPPRDMTRRAFLVGEAHSDNAEGKPIYACFKKLGDDFFARYLTLEQFRGIF